MPNLTDYPIIRYVVKHHPIQYQLQGSSGSNICTANYYIYWNIFIYGYIITYSCTCSYCIATYNKYTYVYVHTNV